MNSQMEARSKVVKMLAGFDTAMLVTHTASGPLDCRPMQVADSEIDRGGPIWFITSAESRKVVEIARDAAVLLIFHEGGRSLAVWGRAHVINDPDHAARLWKEPYRVWFPDGVEDPDLRLIAVEPHSAEYWDEAGADRIRYLFDAEQAYTGTHVDRGDAGHGRTNL